MAREPLSDVGLSYEDNERLVWVEFHTPDLTMGQGFRSTTIFKLFSVRKGGGVTGWPGGWKVGGAWRRAGIR
jgi:hypothetical protein